MKNLSKLIKLKTLSVPFFITLFGYIFGFSILSAQENAENESEPQTIRISVSSTQRIAQIGFSSTVLIENHIANVFNPVESRSRNGETQIGQSSSGSGFVYAITEKEVLIVTNRHVVDANSVDAQKLFVFLPKFGSKSKRVEGKVLYKHPEIDMAVVSVPRTAIQDMPHIIPVKRIVDPRAHAIQFLPGRSVIVIGFPLREQLWTTKGIISTGSSTYQPLAFGMDAPINPGNSGGPVFDEATEVLMGMSTFKLSAGENMGYAIPIYVIDALFQAFRSGEFNEFQGFADLEAQPITLAVLEKSGRLEKLKEKMPELIERFRNLLVFGNPKKSTGLRPGDYLISVEGNIIGDQIEDFNFYLRSTPKRSLKVQVLRGTDIVDVDVPLTNLVPYMKKRENEFVLLNGLFLQDALPNERANLGMDENGVIVNEILHNSFAQGLLNRGLINKGTVIDRIRIGSHKRPLLIKDLNHLKAILSEVKAGTSIEIFLRRKAIRVIAETHEIQEVLDDRTLVISVPTNHVYSDAHFSFGALKENFPIMDADIRNLNWELIAGISCESKLASLANQAANTSKTNLKPTADDFSI